MFTRTVGIGLNAIWHIGWGDSAAAADHSSSHRERGFPVDTRTRVRLLLSLDAVGFVL